MASPVPELAPRLAEALIAFRESGVCSTDAEIVWLAELRWPCDHPRDGSVPWVMGSPLSFSGVNWYPMHRLAESWFVRAMAILAGDEHLQTAAYLYAHAASAPGDRSLQGLMTESAIRAFLSDWLDSQPIHSDADQMAALCDSFRELDGEDGSVPDPDAKPTAPEPIQDDLPQFVATICQAFPGVLPSFWLTELPAHEIRAMLAKVNEGSDNFATSPSRTTAIGNWLKAVKWVWKNHE